MHQTSFQVYLFVPIIDGEIIGTFGTAILQLPVEGGYEGGILKVKCKGQSKLFDNHRSSDARFYLSAFYGSFEYFVEPITRGWQLTLVFDLLWTNTKMMKPYDASVSLVALREIENAANQWITLNKDNSPIANSKVSSAENQVEGAPDPIPLKIILDESDNGNQISNRCYSFLLYNLFGLSGSRLYWKLIKFSIKVEGAGPTTAKPRFTSNNRILVYQTGKIIGGGP